jgi:AraC family transcriptional regulator
MKEPPQTIPLSLYALNTVARRNVTSAAVPSQVVYSSEHVNWTNLLMSVYRHRPGAQIHVPAIAEDAVVLNLYGSTSLSGKIARRFHAEHWQPGNMVSFPKGEAADLQWSDGNDVLVLIPAPSLLISLSAEISDADPSRVEIIERINEHDPLLYHIGLALLTELQANTPAHDLYVDSLTRTFVLHLLKQHTVSPPTMPSTSGKLSPARLLCVLEYIREHLADDLTIQRLAQEANLSPYYFTRLFKQSVGESLHQYVLEQRLEAAKQLLIAGQFSVGEIATRAGFNDQSHLHRHFKRRYGTTPGRIGRHGKNMQNDGSNVQDSDV